MAGLITADSYNHTGIVVKNAEVSAESYYRKLGAGPWKFGEFAGLVKLAHSKVGEITYELLEPKEGVDSLWAAFLAERGEGLHHISHNVADVDAATAELVKDGGKIVVYGGKPVAVPGSMAYIEIGGPGSIILELLKSN
jgi:catechol 2,3-dioxygenase-like lactoylglutathione lyase family enzyme